METYGSLVYVLLFLAPFLLVYRIVPVQGKRYVLLAGNLIFFWWISGIRIVYIVGTAVVTYLTGFGIGMLQEKRNAALSHAEKADRKSITEASRKKQKGLMLTGLLFVLGLLLVLKYTGFAVEILDDILAKVIPGMFLTPPTILAPIGLSFYTLEAIAYLVDVYRETVKPETNFLRLFLFLSFFPKLMEGPICRYEPLAHSIWDGGEMTREGFLRGSMRIFFGLFKKVMIADRLNPLLDHVFLHYMEYDNGVMNWIATLFYMIQLYCEFSGSIDVVIGSAEIMGISLPDNFKQPFFSKNISEFWTRWHITLGTWFKDYIFYPMSLSKPLKNLTKSARKKLGNHYGPLIAGAIALFTVWFCNGLWHGAGWRYIFFGMYHFVLILCGNLIEYPARIVTEKLHIDRQSRPYKAFQIVRTFILVVVGELFFRAHGLSAGLIMFKQLFTRLSFDWITSGRIFTLGMDRMDFVLAGLAVLVLLVVDILKERGVDIRGKILDMPVPARIVLCTAAVLLVVMFGAYGLNYTPVMPIYVNF